LLKTSSTYKAF